MHDESQISNNLRADAPIKNNNRETIIYICECGKEVKSNTSLYRHISICDKGKSLLSQLNFDRENKKLQEKILIHLCGCGKKIFSEGGGSRHKRRCSLFFKLSKNLDLEKQIENKNILDKKIKCGLCKFYSFSLLKHIKEEHALSKEQYEEIHGPTLSQISFDKYSFQNKINLENWEEKFENKGGDLKLLRQKIGKKVSQTIMNDPAERRRRSKQLGIINGSPKSRALSSVRAIDIAKRPEIIEQRSTVLKKWREDNPEKFQEIVQNLSRSFYSKGEKKLIELLKIKFPLFFIKNNFFLKSKNFTLNKSLRKQIDAVIVDKNILIEYDGEIHFRPSPRINLDEIRAKDKMLNEFVENSKKYSLIRVSHDTIQSKKNREENDFFDFFKQEIENAVLNIKPGEIYFIGKKYDKQYFEN